MRANDLEEHTRWDGAGSAVVLVLAASWWGLLAFASGVGTLVHGVIRRMDGRQPTPSADDSNY